MRNTSNQTYKELGITYFKEVFDSIDAVLSELGIPFYLIGVNAIALELLKDGIQPSRGTKDIDFAIMISSINEFEIVVRNLESKGFNKVKAPWTLYHPDYNVAIDLLPFGEIEQNDTVGFNERYSDLHVLGFKEVLAEATEVGIEEKIAQIPPLPGMVLLKLVAWSDRPEERQNDLPDLLLIIQHYYDLMWEEILEEHHDTFTEEEEFDKLIVAARVLGRKASHYLSQSERLYARINRILKDNIESIDKAPIAEEWAKKLDNSVVYAQSLLSALRKGLNEGLKP